MRILDRLRKRQVEKTLAERRAQEPEQEPEHEPEPAAYELWVIEVFDPEHRDIHNFFEMMTVGPPTLTGPYVNALEAMALLEQALDILNANRLPDEQFTGRLRPILSHIV
jgi:hypothetical protein